jgi:branched-chain amino acid transport system permease protein
LPEVLRAIAGLPGLPTWLAQFLAEGRLIIYGILIVAVAVNFPQGLITPNLWRRKRRTKASNLNLPRTRADKP